MVGVHTGKELRCKEPPKRHKGHPRILKSKQEHPDAGEGQGTLTKVESAGVSTDAACVPRVPAPVGGRVRRSARDHQCELIPGRLCDVGVGAGEGGGGEGVQTRRWLLGGHRAVCMCVWDLSQETLKDLECARRWETDLKGQGG